MAFSESPYSGYPAMDDLFEYPDAIAISCGTLRL
jgi:hypothetical protein